MYLRTLNTHKFSTTLLFNFTHPEICKKNQHEEAQNKETIQYPQNQARKKKKFIPKPRNSSLQFTDPLYPKLKTNTNSITLKNNIHLVHFPHTFSTKVRSKLRITVRRK